MIYGVVYRVTCLVTRKRYHGQTINLRERWSHHLRKDSHCHALRNAIAKYGRDKFTFEVVAEASSAEELNSLEEQYVASSLAPLGYNLVEGGRSRRPSAETRMRLSSAHKVIQNLPDVKAKNSSGVKRALARTDVKEKQRAAIQRRFNDPKERERASLKMKEVHARPEEQLKRSQSLRASWGGYSSEAKIARIAKQRASFTTGVRSRMSEAARATWSDPNYVVLQTARYRAAQNRPEVKVATGLRMKALHATPGEKERRGAAISRAHASVEGRAKLARRRRRGESLPAWRGRLKELDERELKS